MRAFAVVLIVSAIAIAGTVGILLVLRPWSGGVELDYALSLPPGSALTPKGAAEEVARILERRAALLGHKPRAFATPDGRVLLRVEGLKREGVDAFRESLERRGSLELLASAEKEVQRRYNEDGVLPKGYRVGRHPGLPGARDYEVWSKGAILLADPPLVVTAEVEQTDPTEGLLPGGPMWQVSIRLHPSAAERFDEAAKKLFARRPEGLVAIVVDGRVVSVPAIRAEKFGGQLVVSGAKDEKEARAWAASWAGGELPCLLRPPKVEPFRGRP